MHSSLMQSSPGAKQWRSGDVSVCDPFALHPRPVLSRYHSTALLVFSQHVRLNVKASFLCRLPTVIQIKSEGSEKSEDTQCSRPTKLNLTGNARSVRSINALGVLWPLTWPKCGTPDLGGGWGVGVSCSSSALVLASLCMCFQLRTKERRSCAACGSV